MNNPEDSNRTNLFMKLPGPPVMLVVIAILAVIAIFLRLSSQTTVSANFGDLSLAESTYPQIVGKSIDTCALCHTSAPQLNPYGAAYKAGGRGVASSLTNIQNQDSDGDGFTNLQEINASTFPGDPNSHPAAAATATPTATSVPPSATPTATRVSPSNTPTSTQVGPTATMGPTSTTGPTSTKVPTQVHTPRATRTEEPTRMGTPRVTRTPRSTRTPSPTQVCNDDDQDNDDGIGSGGDGSGGDDLHITQPQSGTGGECDDRGGDDDGGGHSGGGHGRGGDGGGDDLQGAILLPDRWLGSFARLPFFH
jgi:hypothetical protein